MRFLSSSSRERTEILKDRITGFGLSSRPPARRPRIRPPDLFDVVWAVVQRAEVFRGPVSATSRGVEIDARGVLWRSVWRTVAAFRLDTDKDFGRYEVSDRPLST